MTPRERSLFLRIQRRANTLSPELARELLDAYRAIRDSLSPADLERLIASGQFDAIVDEALLDRSLGSFRERLQVAVERGFKVTVPDLPKGGTIDGQLGVMFDRLNPDVISAIRDLDSRVINTLKADVRDTVRAFVENGLRDGRSPRDIGRDLRAVIGMSPTQTENAAKYEAKLRALKRKPLTEAQIEQRVAAYQRKAIRLNADTNAHTATLDSLKLGQQLTWEDAQAKGIVKPGQLFKRWVSVGDDRVRPEHVAMHGEEVPADAHYSNGDFVPGESTFRCRCISIFVVRKAA